jgi:hypothetical protein
LESIRILDALKTNFKGVKYCSSQNAWMTSKIFKEELIRWDSELISSNRKVLLLVDNCPSHIIDSTILSNIKLVFLPPNTTSKLQPLDNGIIKNFKVFYRKKLVSKLLGTIDNNEEFKINVLESLLLSEYAWEAITTNTIVNCFKILAMNDSTTLNLNNVVNSINDSEMSNIISLFKTEKSFDEYVAVDDDILTYAMIVKLRTPTTFEKKRRTKSNIRDRRIGSFKCCERFLFV